MTQFFVQWLSSLAEWLEMFPIRWILLLIARVTLKALVWLWHIRDQCGQFVTSTKFFLGNFRPLITLAKILVTTDFFVLLRSLVHERL